MRDTRGRKTKRKYMYITPEFIDQFKQDLADGYSLYYSARNLLGGIEKIKKSYDKHPELKIVVETYLYQYNLKKFKTANSAY